MPNFLHDKRSLFWRKRYCIFLAFFWIAGLVCGILTTCRFADAPFASLMRGVPLGPVSIVGVLCVTALPFLLSVFAVSISQPWLLLPIFFGKAFLFAFVSFGVVRSWCYAGWLVQALLMFRDWASMPLHYFLGLRCLSGGRKLSLTEGFLLSSALILIGSIDISIISPFLAGIIDF